MCVIYVHSADKKSFIYTSHPLGNNFGVVMLLLLWILSQLFIWEFKIYGVTAESCRTSSETGLFSGIQSKTTGEVWVKKSGFWFFFAMTNSDLKGINVSWKDKNPP